MTTIFLGKDGFISLVITEARHVYEINGSFMCTKAILFRNNTISSLEEN